MESGAYAARIRETERLKGMNHSSLILMLYNLGLLLRQEENVFEAKKVAAQAMTLAEEHCGIDSLACAKCLDLLAQCCLDEGKSNKAVALMRSSLDVRQKLLGDMHLDLLPALDRLVEAQTITREFSAAYDLCERAVAISEGMYGVSHPETSVRLERLARLLEKQGRHDEARPLRLYAARCLEDSLGQTDYLPALASSLDVLRLNRQSMSRSIRHQCVSRCNSWSKVSLLSSFCSSKVSILLTVAAGVVLGEYVGLIGNLLLSLS
jgi:tetratricopeptide (TPR) repeat protein